MTARTGRGGAAGAAAVALGLAVALAFALAVALALAAALAAWAPAAGAAPGADAARSDATRAGGSRADAAALYNAGTAALERGDTGPAVTLLRAAQRIDPRAADIRRNLAEARTRAAAGRGTGQPAQGTAGLMLLSPEEAWWLAAALLALGATLALARLLGRASTRARPGRPAALLPAASAALVLAGALLAGYLGWRAREESLHPAAVVVVPVLDVGPAPDERPRPPYLLGAGEEVRLGRARGALVEIRIGGTVVGWAARSGVWRVADAARYTPPLQ